MCGLAYEDDTTKQEWNGRKPDENLPDGAVGIAA